MADKRIIDANALLKEFEKRQEQQINEYCDCFLNDAQELSTEWWCVEDAVAAAPTIDAVEVVRCRECIHRGYDACPMCHDEYYYDEDDGADFWTVDNTEDDGFCHMGAKMDGGVSDGSDA